MSQYRYKKGGRVVHIVNEQTGYIVCGADLRYDFNASSSYIPSDKMVCGNCSQTKYRNYYLRARRKRRKDMKLKDMYGFYGTAEWANLRFDVLKDADRCLCCGASKEATRLTVDHIKPISKYPELRAERSNLQVLCMLCNKGKGAEHEVDFRAGETVQTRLSSDLTKYRKDDE